MKVRTGFVSNSSSSSFLIYGAYVEKSEVPEEIREEYGDEWYEWVQEQATVAGIDMEYGDYDSRDECGVCVGMSPTSVPDDKTMGEWKKEIEEAIKKTFGEKSCGWHEDAWYNG